MEKKDSSMKRAGNKNEKERDTTEREKKVAPTPYDAHRRPPNWAEFIPSEREIELERKREETCRVDAA